MMVVVGLVVFRIAHARQWVMQVNCITFKFNVRECNRISFSQVAFMSAGDPLSSLFSSSTPGYLKLRGVARMKREGSHDRAYMTLRY
jgi:hypothetical protein